MNLSSRTDFNETWLCEMPMGIGQTGDQFFNSITSNIQDYITYGTQPDDLGNGFKKIKGSQVAFYWHETDGIIDIAAEFTIKPQALIVNGVAKHSSSVIHASDLYEVVLNDNDKSIKFMSDEKLSDDGYNLWKRLLTSGHTVSVYDGTNPGHSLKTLHTVDEMDDFFKQYDNTFSRWQFVLSESGMKLAETRSYFNTCRLRELSGLL